MGIYASLSLAPIPSNRLTSPMPSSPSKYVAEGGKFHLAEALFNAFRYKIRCPSCAGNPAQPGFIKDEGGKGGKQGQKRRQWKCQRSNARSAKSQCGRASCTEYIDLARQQLDHAQFDNVLQRVCQKFPPEQEDYATLQGYFNSSPGQSDTPSIPEPRPVFPAIFKPQGALATTPDLPRPPSSKKRKAEEELPFRDKTAGHSQARQRREQSDTSHLRDTLQHLKELVKISKTWEDDYRKLSLFLASSSPPQRTPSCTAPSWSSPSLDLPSVFSSDGLPSDATIPNTYPEDSLSSSPPPEPPSSPAKYDLSSSIPEQPPRPSSPLTVYVTGASVPPMFGTILPTPAKPSPSPSSSAQPSSARTLPDPVGRAKELAQQFLDARLDATTLSMNRRAIRNLARAEGVYVNFQRFLNQPTELKRSDRT